MDPAFERREPPVAYAGIHTTLHRVRLAGSGTLIALAVLSLRLELPGMEVRLVALGVMFVDALWRMNRPGKSALPSLILDSIIIGSVAGWAGDVAPSVIASVAYLLTASMLVLPMRHAVLAIGTAAAAILVRVILSPASTTIATDATDAVAWAEMAVYLAALTIVLVTAISLLYVARARTEAALAAERRAVELKNEFVSMVSHELRTPLTNISGFALTVQDSWRVLEPSEVDEFLDIITDEAEHLKGLVEDVLTIPRLEAGRLTLEETDFQLRPAAYRMTDVLFPPGGVKQASVTMPGNVVVHADSNRVQQVLRNLLENARKYGGEQIVVDAEVRDDDVLVTVSDDGRGIPEHDRERIFQRFEQLSTGDTRTDTGFGLGLPIARMIIRSMGGDLWHEPRFPVGSRFSFTLRRGSDDPGVGGAKVEAQSSA